MTVTQEIWKEIPGADGRYFASTYGRIKSIFKSKANTYQGKRYKPVQPERILSPGLLRVGYSKGYLQVHIVLNNKRTPSTVHHLVTLTFLGEKPKGSQVNHKDGNGLNNCLSNLEYTSCSGNINHAWASGLVKRKAIYLSDEAVEKARALYFRGDSIKVISEQLGVSHGYISAIVHNKRRVKGY